jgi:hypothetical protein
MSGCIYNYTRWILGGIFIYAGSTKLLEPKAFTVLIEAYGIVPESLLMPVALALPLLEVAAGIGLFFDIEGSLSVITGLLGLFSFCFRFRTWTNGTSMKLTANPMMILSNFWEVTRTNPSLSTAGLSNVPAATTVRLGLSNWATRRFTVIPAGFSPGKVQNIQWKRLNRQASE